MPTNPLRVTVASTELRTLSDSPQEAVFILFLGEALTLSFEENVGTISCAVGRAPATSAASFSGGAITPDVIGYYRLTAASNSANPARACHAVVFPLAAKTDFRVAQPARRVMPWGVLVDPAPRSEAFVRGLLLRYVTDRRETDLSTFDALTANAPLPASVDWRRYAADDSFGRRLDGY